MTREEALDIIENHDYTERELNEALGMAIKALEQESKIEEEIREELNRISTYRVPNSETDLVTRKAVERVLNLVFRGWRDKEPKADVLTEIKKIVTKWEEDSWTDNLSYECMIKIAGLVKESEE